MVRRPFRPVVVVLVLVLLAVAGCSGGDGAGGKGGEGPPGTIRYSYWGSGERIRRTQAVINLFEKAYPKYKVKGEPRDFDSHWEQLTIQSAAHGAPCVPQMQNRYMADYSTRGQLRPLDDLVKSGAIKVDGIPKSILDTGRGSDGKLYNAVTGVYFYVQFYNADILKNAGVSVPTNDMTWDEWEAWLRDLAKKLPKGVVAADLLTATDFSGAFFNYVYGHGEKAFTDDGKLGFDQKILTDWWTMWNDLRKDGVTTTAASLSDRDPALEQSPLATGKVAWNAQPQNQLTQTNAASTANDLGHIKAAKLPNGPAGAGETFGSNGVSISTSCPDDRVAEAAKFLNFYVNDPQAAKAYGSTNGAVSKVSLQEAQINDPNTDPSLVEGLKLLQTVVNKYHPQGYVYPAGGRAASDAFTRAATSVFLGQATPEAAAKSFMAEANGALHGPS